MTVTLFENSVDLGGEGQHAKGRGRDFEQTAFLQMETALVALA